MMDFFRGAVFDIDRIHPSVGGPYDWTITATRGNPFLTWVEALSEAKWKDFYVYTKTVEKRKTGRKLHDRVVHRKAG